MGSTTEYPNRYYDHLPVWIDGNLYCNGAGVYDKELRAVIDDGRTVEIGLEEREDGWYLETNLYDALPDQECEMISTEKLGFAFEPEQKYENPDGTPIVFNRDYFGQERPLSPVPGPFRDAQAAAGKLF